MMVKRPGRHGPTGRPRALLALKNMPVVQRRLIIRRPPRRPAAAPSSLMTAYLTTVPAVCTVRVYIPGRREARQPTKLSIRDSSALRDIVAPNNAVVVTIITRHDSNCRVVLSEDY